MPHKSRHRYRPTASIPSDRVAPGSPTGDFHLGRSASSKVSCRGQRGPRGVAVDWGGGVDAGPSGAAVRMQLRSADHLLRELGADDAGESEEDGGIEERVGSGSGVPLGGHNSFAALMDVAAARYSGVTWATAARLIERRWQLEDEGQVKADEEQGEVKEAQKVDDDADDGDATAGVAEVVVERAVSDGDSSSGSGSGSGDAEWCLLGVEEGQLEDGDDDDDFLVIDDDMLQ